MCGLDAYNLGQKPVADSCEHGNESSISIKGGKCLDWLSVLSVSQEDPWTGLFVLMTLISTLIQVPG
jgi:hypothetical protein